MRYFELSPSTWTRRSAIFAVHITLLLLTTNALTLPSPPNEHTTLSSTSALPPAHPLLTARSDDGTVNLKITCQSTAGSPLISDVRALANGLISMGSSAKCRDDSVGFKCTTLRRKGSASVNFCRDRRYEKEDSEYCMALGLIVNAVVQRCEEKREVWGVRVGGMAEILEPLFAGRVDVFHS